jgi:hypothetical protein
MVLGAASLSKAQSRALAFIHSAATKGIGANETLRQLFAAGEGVQRKWGLKTYASYAGTAKAGYAIQNVRHDYFPSFARLPVSATNMKDKYGMNVRVSKTRDFEKDGITPIYKSLWVTSNDKHITQWYLDKAQEYVETVEGRTDESEGELVPFVVIESVQRNPIFG